MSLTRRDFLRMAGGAIFSLLTAEHSAEAAWTCNVPPGSPHGPSKLGFHVVGGNPMVPYIQQLRDNGTYFKLIKCADDFGAA